MKKKTLSFLILSIFCFSVGVFAIAGSASADLRENILSPELNTVSKDVYNATDANPDQSVQDIIVLVVNAVLGLLGVIFLVLIIYAGFLWMTAGGNEDQVSKAKKLLTNSIIGVIIVVAAYAISWYVLSKIIT